MPNTYGLSDEQVQDLIQQHQRAQSEQPRQDAVDPDLKRFHRFDYHGVPVDEASDAAFKKDLLKVYGPQNARHLSLDYFFTDDNTLHRLLPVRLDIVTLVGKRVGLSMQREELARGWAVTEWEPEENGIDQRLHSLGEKPFPPEALTMLLDGIKRSATQVMQMQQPEDPIIEQNELIADDHVAKRIKLSPAENVLTAPTIVPAGPSNITNLASNSLAALPSTSSPVVLATISATAPAAPVSSTGHQSTRALAGQEMRAPPKPFPFSFSPFVSSNPAALPTTIALTPSTSAPITSTNAMSPATTPAGTALTGFPTPFTESNFNFSSPTNPGTWPPVTWSAPAASAAKDLNSDSTSLKKPAVNAGWLRDIDPKPSFPQPGDTQVSKAPPITPSPVSSPVFTPKLITHGLLKE